jgi:predicted nucleotidyltransferase component of viral defense system
LILHKETVSDTLWESLDKLMNLSKLKDFRIVGGTSLSLQLGHRISVDIDLFTDVEYGSVDFKSIEDDLSEVFPYFEVPLIGKVALGKTYFMGDDEENALKLDLFYTDEFAFPLKKFDNIRFSSIEEVAAMKLEIIANNGRKKDFWDIHELLKIYSINQLIEFYSIRNPYGFGRENLLHQLVDFSKADQDLEPNCLKGKIWEFIKIDIEEAVQGA